MARKPPLLASPTLQTAAIGLVMMLLLAGSMVLAWGLTAAPLTPPSAPEESKVNFGDAAIALPAAWTLDAATTGTITTKSGQIATWHFVNSVSPAQSLRILRFNADQAQEPKLMLSQLVPQMIGMRSVITTDGKGDRHEERSTPDGEFIDLVFSTKVLSPVATAPRLHAISLFTPDRQRYWVYQLTDQVQAQNWNRNSEVENLEQLRVLLDTVDYPSS